MNQRILPPDDSKFRHSKQVAELDNRYNRDCDGYMEAEYRPIPAEENGPASYMETILRRKRIAIIVLATVFIGSIVYTFLVDPVYRSTATLEIEKETGASLSSIGESLTQGLTGVGENEIFATQIGIIKDRSMADELIRRQNLAESPEFKAPSSWLSEILDGIHNEIASLIGNDTSGVSRADRENETLIDKVQERISARRDGQSRLITVAFDATTPRLSQKLLQTLIELYLAKNLDKRRRVQREAINWLDSEIEKAESKVLKSLASIAAFSQKHGLVAVEEGSNHILSFFQKAAEGLVKTKEQRIGMEAFQKNGNNSHVAAAISGVKTPDMEQLHAKLSILEAEHAQMMEIYSENYPKVVLLKKQITFLKQRIEEGQAKAVESIVNTAKEQENLSEQAFENAKRMAMDTKSLGVQFAVLKKEAQTNEEIYSLLLKKSKELQLSTEIIGNNIMTVVNPTLPVQPIKPRMALNLAIGAMVGIFMGIGAAFLRERLDTSIYDTRDLERLGMPLLGMIPNYEHIRKLEGKSMKDCKKRERAEFVAATDPSSMFADAFSIVRTSLLLTTSNVDIRTLLITSSVPGEGKSFVSAALSGILAAYGKRVLLVEADFRKPRLSKLFEKKHDSPGLSTLLTFPKVSIDKCIGKLSTPNLFFMGTGPRPEDPARLLASPKLSELLSELRKQFDFVIVDSPPIEGLPDSRNISTSIDRIVFVVRQGHASSDVIRSASSSLKRIRHNIILGAIFNNVGVSSSGHSSSGLYGAYYGRIYSTYGYNSYYRPKKDNKLAIG